jgi:hypothetical protein
VLYGVLIWPVGETESLTHVLWITDEETGRDGTGWGYSWNSNRTHETKWYAVFAFAYDLNLNYERRWRVSSTEGTLQLDTWHSSYTANVIVLVWLSLLNPHIEICWERDRSIMALVSAGSLLTAGSTRGMGVIARANGKSQYPAAVWSLFLITRVCDHFNVPSDIHFTLLQVLWH